MSNRAWQTARSHSWCKTVVTALLLLPVVATAADLRIRAELLHLRQTGPTSDYKIYGAPGAAPSLTDIDALYASGDAETIVRSAVDGSFAMLVDYAKAKDGLSVIARGVDSTESDPVALRLDYPRQGGMGGPPNARGFFNIVPATADVASESKPWIEASRALSQTGVFPVDARQLPLAGLDTLAMGTDLIIYGHSPDGDAATCVIGPTGFWVSTGVTAGVFQLRVPYDQIHSFEGGRWSPGSVIVTITSGNEIVATSGFNPAFPDWVAGTE